MENEFSPCCTYGLITAFRIGFAELTMCHRPDGTQNLVAALIGNWKLEIRNFVNGSALLMYFH
jgi:hypothetical protein